ncbi:ATP-binding cassette domain-containing protein [Spongorhabdus nitratireducens]
MIQLEYQNLSLKSDNVAILDQINFEIDGPGVFALLGPSGTGKSTLLRATQRMIESDDTHWQRSGDILLNGKSVFASSLGRHQLARQIGYIPQRPRMLHGSVLANVEFALKHTTRLSAEEIRTKALAALAEVDVTSELPTLDKAASELSGGQAQRVAIARAIALNPSVLLMDEPSTGLDPFKVQLLEQVIRNTARLRLVVLVTHDVVLARRLAKWVGFILPGENGSRLVEFGATEQVFDRPQDPVVKEFIALGSGLLGDTDNLDIAAREMKTPEQDTRADADLILALP